MRFALAAVAVALLLSGCVQQSLSGGAGSSPSTVLPRDPRGENITPNRDPAVCEQKELRYRDLCYINTAPQVGDTSLCDKIKGQSNRELCYGRVGVAIGDPKLCDRISDQSVRQQCHYALQQKN
jgi:hypothetical protein